MPTTPEQRMWSRLRPVLSRYDPIRIETSTCPGVPDVHTTLGWIELKVVEYLPKRATTNFKIRSLTAAQAAFLHKRAGDPAFLFVHIQETDRLVVWGGDDVQLHLSRNARRPAPFSATVGNAWYHGPMPPRDSENADVLRNGLEAGWKCLRRTQIGD